MNTLLMDIGNSTVEMAPFDGAQIGESTKIPTSEFQNLELLRQYDRIVVSSVVPGADVVLSPLKTVHFVTSETIPTLKLNVDIPAQVGADRLVNALGAYSEYGTDCLVVDSGTAITFCRVDKDGVYQGGAIVPGMGIASQALSLYTAKIPLIEVSKQDVLFGKTTKEAVQVGLYLGYIHLINGMIRDIREKYSEIKVVGAGSGLDVLRDRLDLDVYDPRLTLKGLAVCAEGL